MGVVLMHGTAASPAGSNAKLAGLLRLAGAIVVEPRMAWSRSRIYDASWEQERVEIDQAIAQLRSMGARYVVLGGHSRGGAATVAYAAQRHRPDALVVLAPGSAGPAGQPPELYADRADIREEEARARQLVQTGYGDVWGSFLEADVSRLLITIRFYVTTTARIYVSYHSPGFGGQPNAPRVPRIPVLFVTGALDMDLAQQRIEFSLIPKNPRSRYLELPDTFHEDVPDHAQRHVLAWLQSLRW
jgi:pimeloyl-ACP methyl ester carboxylesterase